MPRLLYTTDDLVSEVRSLLDEQNTDSVNTDTDILPALNRGLQYAADMYARMYPEPLLTYSTLDLTSGTAEYTIPENVFEDRVLKIEISIPTGSRSVQVPLERVSYSDISELESTATSSVPQYYTMFGRTLRLFPTPNGTYDARMWYLREPEVLVLEQGRINSVNSGSLYVEVDAIGSALSTNTNNLASYVNVIDGQTGEIKSTMQLQTTTAASLRLTFRSSPTQSSVLGRTIATSMASTTQVNDYVCLVQGTCVPYYGAPTNNFLVQFAVAEITRKLGGSSSTEQEVLAKFEKQLERNWAGRNTRMQIKRRSSAWPSSYSRSVITPRTGS